MEKVISVAEAQSLERWLLAECPRGRLSIQAHCARALESQAAQGDRSASSWVAVWAGTPVVRMCHVMSPAVRVRSSTKDV
eukprot:5479234-Pyramimonas_sp.AAC.1